MIIFINKPREFELATILRTLYYSTKFINLNIYVDGSFKDIDVIRYSRVPINDYKNYIKKEKPKTFPKDTYVVDPDSGTDIKEVKNIDCLVVDFSGEYKRKFNGVSGVGLSLLHYEAVSIFYEMFIKRLREEIPNLNNRVDKISLYLAKKLLEFIDYDFIDMKKMQYILQHAHPERKILVQVNRQIVERDSEKVMIKYFVTFYNKNMEKILCSSKLYSYISRSSK